MPERETALDPDRFAAEGSSARSSGRLHVWMVNQYAVKFPGPGGTRHHFLADGMRQHQIDTTIIAGQPDGGATSGAAGQPAEDDVRFVWVPIRAYSGNGLGRILNMTGFAWRVLRLGWRPQRHRLQRPDVVVGSTPQPFAALAAWAVARRHRVPFVFEVRDLWPDSLVAILGVSRFHPLVVVFGAIEKFLYSHSDRIVGVLDGVAEHARLRVGDKMPPTTWVPNGVLLDALPDVTPVRPPGEEFRVLYTGAHGPPNSLDTLLKAAELLQTDDTSGAPRIRFDLYGEGTSKQELMDEAARRRLRNVHFHSPVPKNEVYQLLADADATVLLLPRLDLWKFGISPNKLFDYLGAARPVILAVDSPGDPVTRASAGVKATAQDPDDLAARIRELAAMPLDERRRMGERGRAYVELNHDMPVLAARYAEVIQQAAKGHGDPRPRVAHPSPSASSGGPDPAPISLWVINQYAAKYPGPGLTRHHFLAGAMQPLEVTTTIISDSPALRGAADHRARVEQLPDARFVWLPTRPYSGNGLGRIINMAGFSRSVLRWGWNPQPGDKRPDIILGSSPQPFSALAGWILARRHGIPFVFEVRDLWPESLVAILGMNRRHPLVMVIGALEKFLYRNSDHIIGVLDGVGDYVRMRVGRKAAPVSWIPNGVPLQELPDPRPLPEPGDEFRVVYAGSHGPPNGLDTLLKAAEVLESELAGSGPKIRIDLYGGGASKDELVAYARSRGLSSVHFHDPVSRNEIFERLAEADATVALLPGTYLWRFGISPNKLIDYFAAARPVVLAVDAPSDPVTRANAGIKAEAQNPADLAATLREMATIPFEDRRAMGERGRAYAAANHDMPVLGEKFAAVLRTSIAKRTA